MRITLGIYLHVVYKFFLDSEPVIIEHAIVFLARYIIMAFTNNPRPAIQKGWVRALVLFIVYLGIYFLTAAVWALRNPGVPLETLIDDPVLHVLVLVVSEVLAIGTVLLFRRFADRQPVYSMGFAWKGHQRDAWAGFLLGPVLLGTGSLILFSLHYISWTDTRPDAGAIATGLVLFLFTALSEELVFRGYILNNLMSSLSRWPALGASAVLFALTHLGNAHLHPIALLNLLAGGLLLGINYVYTRNLWFSLFFHFSWNFFQGPVLGYEVSGIGLESLWHMERKGNELFTGGAFGFEGSVVATGLLAVALAFCGYRKWWER